MRALEDDAHVLREREPRSGWILPLSIVAALALALVAWRVFSNSGPGSAREFRSAELGCRFEYPRSLASGPNFVRSGDGALLTVERHSLQDARRDFVAQLPDVLLAQVRAQVEQNYRDLAEVSRRKTTIGGKTALQAVLAGHSGHASSITTVTVDIVATDDWVYVLRTYVPEGREEADQAAFDMVRRTFSFLAEGTDG